MRTRLKLIGVLAIGIGIVSILALRRSPSDRPPVAKSDDVSAAPEMINRAAPASPNVLSEAEAAKVMGAVRTAADDYFRSPRPQLPESALHLGLAPEYLVPLPPEERPTKAEIATFNAAAADERAHATRPEPPDPNLLIGLLAAVQQVTENPALRSALENAYLDAVMGLDESEAAEARKKLERITLAQLDN